MVWGWSRPVPLCLRGSVWFSAGLCWSRCVCVVLCGSVWFWVGFRWSRCVCVILYGLGLVSAGLAVLVWFCMVFCWSVVAALSLFNSVWSWVGFSWPRCVCLVVYFGLVSAGLATFVWFYVGGWGVCPNREILMGPACVIPSLGLWTSISPPVVRRALRLLASSSGVLKKNINIRSTVQGF